MKIVKQHDNRDCGAACLSMIAAHYGLKIPISKYRTLIKTDRNGTNLYGLVAGARKLGFSAEALSGNLDELIAGISDGSIRFPFVAHVITEDSMQHFVVVLNIKSGKFIVGDPATGKVKYTYEDFAQLWTGHLVTFEKTDALKKGNYSKGSFLKFFALLKGQYSKLVGVIALSLTISLIGITGAFVFQVVIDDFYNNNELAVCEEDCGENHTHITTDTASKKESVLEKAVNLVYANASNFNLLFAGLIGLYVLQSFIHFIRSCLMTRLSKKIDMRLMLPYYNHIIDLSVSDISTRNTGEYMSRFSDASTIREAVSGATLTLLIDSFMVITCGVILFAENSTLFYISLVIIILYAIIIICYKKPIEKINREVMENNARVQSYLKETIDGVETIKANQAELSTKDKNTAKFHSLMNSVVKDNIISASQDSLCGMVELVGIAIILWIGFGMVLTEVITVGSLITFYSLLAYFTEPIKNLIGLQPMLQTAIVAAERLNDILDITPENSLDTQNKKLKWKKLKISNVDFRYGNHELTLKNISLEIEKGEKIAIIGESGCGKTTLVKLLMKFYIPENGSVTVDDIDYRNLSVYDIRRNIAYVDQNTFLFSDTIKNNLMLGNTQINDDQIIHACKVVAIDKFIQTLPFGYDTYLDENGKNLSGGQRQRLAIARALLRNPKIIIFDEATSNLDAITETAIKDTIFNLNKDMPCIIIAHRLSTIVKCDKIIVMDKGEIVECGTHADLLSKKGYYYEMHNRQ